MMEQKTLLLRVLSPDRTILEAPVDMVVFRTVEGEMGVLPEHTPCVVMLDSGMMKVRRDDLVETYVVSGGFAMIDRDSVVVASTLAEREDRMEDLLRELEEQRLKRKAEGKRWESEVTRAEMAIRRVLMNREISAYSLLKGKGEDGELL